VYQIFPVPAEPAAEDCTVAGYSVDKLAELYAYPEPDTVADRPWVRANMITSLDGAATAEGRSGGLSGPADRLVFSVLRSLADVILVGAGTARIERYHKMRVSSAFPQLREGRSATPPIAVVTRHLDLDLDGRLLTSDDDSAEASESGASESGASESGLARTVLLTTEAAPAERRAAAARTADVVVAGQADVAASAAVDALAALGHRRILCEGGPTLLSQLAAAELVDELCLTISPVLAGGKAGRIVAPAELGRAAGLTLASVLTDDGYLLCRYLRSDPR
jgi:riboflavin biosynthesis pyrimidine reductase